MKIDLDEILNSKQYQMTWYKKEIINLIQHYKDYPPYSYWNENLFETVNPDMLREPIIDNGIDNESIIDETMMMISATMGTWERVIKTVQLWSDNQAIDNQAINAVNLAYILSAMYLCLLYPRQNALEYMAKKLE
jgi:hypothetical protein